MTDRFAALEAIIASRLASGSAEYSYVARLAGQGLPEVARKVGEEAVETVIAGLAQSDEALTAEAADLVFHLAILLQMRGLGLGDVATELDRRHGASGLEEKAARKDQSRAD